MARLFPGVAERRQDWRQRGEAAGVLLEVGALQFTQHVVVELLQVLRQFAGIVIQARPQDDDDLLRPHQGIVRRLRVAAHYGRLGVAD